MSADLVGLMVARLTRGARLRHYPVARFGIADDGPQLIEEALD